MKINFFKSIIFILGIFILAVLYFSTIGIETKKFNQQIVDKFLKNNENLNVDLKKVKLTLDPIKFHIKAKTVGATVFYLNRPLELDYIQTNVSLVSIFKNKFVSSSFKIVTKSILLKDILKLTRSITFRPEFLILETIIQDGYIILDLNINLDQNGKIKNDYEVKGLLKKGKVKFLKNIDFEKISLLFSLKEKEYLFRDINFSSDTVDFKSDLLKIFKIDNMYLFEGELENSKSVVPKNFVKLLNLNFKKIDIENTKFSSKNNFEFQIDRKFKLQNLKFETQINFNQVRIKDINNISNYFPEIKKNLLLKNHDLRLKYEKNMLSGKGKGNIKIGNNTDQIVYLISKKKDNFEFETDVKIKKITLKNQNIIKNNFPLTKDLIDLKDHKLNIKYKDQKLYLKGDGDIRLEKEFNKIKYSLLENNDEFHLKSEINLQNISLKNKKILKKFFPLSNNLIKLKNQKIKITYKKNFLSFSGDGKIKIDNEFENINYFISRENNETNFDINANLNLTNFQIENLNYKKTNKITTLLNISGSFLPSEKLIFRNLSILDKESKIKISNIVFDKDNLLIDLGEANFDYIDTENKSNLFAINKEDKNKFKLNGLFFNANTIISNLLKNKENKENEFIKNTINILLNVNEVYLDDVNFIKNLQGSVSIIDDKIINANLSANFDNNNNIIFTISTKDDEKITKLYSSKAKPLVYRYKFIKGFDEGYLDFKSTKKGDKSISNLKIYDFKLKELPGLTKLLTLASLQGIADILTGEGIRFDEFEMNFNNKGNIMIIDEIYAIGPAISILINGYVEENKLISLRGTLVPATTINKTIRKIPMLGKILVGKKVGEGVFGVSFKIKGPPKNLETTVNPIKTLTPRFITRTLDKLKKN